MTRPLSRSWTSSPPAITAIDLAAARGIGQLAGQQQAQVLLFGEDRARRLVGIRRDDDFGEDLRDRFGGRRIERPVGGDDSAERRDAVAGQRLVPGIEQAVARGDSARVGVLDDDDRRRPVAELGDEVERGTGVVEVVVAELLALHLLGLGDAARVRADRHVERRLLVRVLAVAQRHLELARR